MQIEATMTEIIEGPIAAVDRVYAFDEIGRVCGAAPRAVQRVRARLTAGPHPTDDSPVTAECWLLLEGGLIICAGTAANTMRRAVDALIARLGRRLRQLDNEPRGPSPLAKRGTTAPIGTSQCSAARASSSAMSISAASHPASTDGAVPAVRGVFTDGVER